MTDFILPGERLMDRAWMRDKNSDVLYTGEALVLACLLHAKGKTRRGQDEIEQVAKMMKDPNLNRKKKNPSTK